MTELPELPPFERRTRPLPAGGLDAAITGGRRRRQRAMAGAGGALSALVVLVAVVALPGGSPDALETAERPDPTASSTPAVVERSPEEAPPSPTPPLPAARPTDVTGTALPQPSGPPVAVTAAPAPPRAGATAAAPPAGPRPTPGRPTQEPITAGPAKPVDQRPAYVEDTDEDAPGGSACMATKNLPSGGCTYVSAGSGVRDVVRRGEQVQAVVGYCTSTGDQDHRFLFDDGQEKEVVVTGAGQEVFRFSSTVRYVQGPHERVLRAGRCVQWTGRWDLVTSDGRPVPAGDYDVTMTVTIDRTLYFGMEEGPRSQVVTVRVTVVD